MNIPALVHKQVLDLVKKFRSKEIILSELVRQLDSLEEPISLVSLDTESAIILYQGSRFSVDLNCDAAILQNQRILMGKIADLAGIIVGEDLNMGCVTPISPLEMSPILKQLKQAVSEYNRTVQVMTK